MIITIITYNSFFKGHRPLSAIINFTLEYKEHNIKIVQADDNVEMYIENSLKM